MTTNRSRIARLALVASGAITCIATLAPPSAHAETPAAPPAPIGPGQIAGLSDSGLYLGTANIKSVTSSSFKLIWNTNASHTSVTLSSTKPTKVNGRWVFGGDAAISGANVMGTGWRSYTAKNLGEGQTYWYVLSAPTNLNQVPVEKMGKATAFAPKGETDLAGMSESGYEITSIASAPKGTTATISWKTNADSTQIKFGGSEPKKVNGKWVFTGTGASFAATVNGSGNRHYEATNLAPGTKYWFVLTAPTAANQPPVQQVGNLTTLRRQVEAHFQKIRVSSDADGAFKGAGEITFYFRLVGAPTSEGYYKKLSSGDNHTINYHGNGAWVAVIANAPSKITLATQGAEDDQGLGDWCPYGTGGTWPGELVQESNDCFDFSFADGTFDVPSTTTWFPFTIEVHRSPALVFQVSGYVSVNYVA